jgi:transcriptional regulator with XRE-family HTH domain
MKQTDLAKHLNIAQSTLSGWETEKFDIDRENIFRLANFFQVTTDYLLGREEQQKPAAPGSDGLDDIIEIFTGLPPERRKKMISYGCFLKQERDE